MSPPTIAELRRVLAYPKFRLHPDRQDRVVAEYLSGAEHIAPDPAAAGIAQLCRDPKDRMFVILALTPHVPIVSGDTDLTILKGQLPIDVLTLPELRLRLEG